MHDKMISKALLRIFRHGDNEPDDGGKRDECVKPEQKQPGKRRALLFQTGGKQFGTYFGGCYHINGSGEKDQQLGPDFAFPTIKNEIDKSRENQNNCSFQGISNNPVAVEMKAPAYGEDDISHQIKTVIEIIEQPIKQKNQRENREEKEKYFFCLFYRLSSPFCRFRN